METKYLRPHRKYFTNKLEANLFDLISSSFLTLLFFLGRGSGLAEVKMTDPATIRIWSNC